MKQEQQDSILHFFSKFSIAIPIVIIVIALLFKPNETYLPQNEVKQIPTVIPSPQANTQADNPFMQMFGGSASSSQDKVKLSLDGPLICNYEDKTASISAHIKNKSIYLNLQQNKVTSQFILKGDCLYAWEKGQYTGVKTCGLSQAVSMVDMLSQFNMISIDSIIGMAMKQGYKVGTASALLTNASNLMKTCVKQDVDDAKFTIPTNVYFKVAPTPTQAAKQ